MNESLNPKVAAEKAGDSFRKAAARFEEIAVATGNARARGKEHNSDA